VISHARYKTTVPLSMRMTSFSPSASHPRINQRQFFTNLLLIDCVFVIICNRVACRISLQWFMVRQGRHDILQPLFRKKWSWYIVVLQQTARQCVMKKRYDRHNHCRVDMLKFRYKLLRPPRACLVGESRTPDIGGLENVRFFVISRDGWRSADEAGSQGSGRWLH